MLRILALASIALTACGGQTQGTIYECNPKRTEFSEKSAQSTGATKICTEKQGGLCGYVWRDFDRSQKVNRTDVQTIQDCRTGSGGDCRCGAIDEYRNADESDKLTPFWERWLS